MANNVPSNDVRDESLDESVDSTRLFYYLDDYELREPVRLFIYLKTFS